MDHRYLLYLGNDKKRCIMNGIRYRAFIDSSVVNSHRKLSIYTHRQLAQFTHAGLNKDEEIGVTE